MVRVSLAGDVVLVHAVMRQMDERVSISALAQPCDVLAEHLADRLIVIEHPDFLPDPLHDPDREGISGSPRAADVDEGP
jgi:hypothetical protein